MVAGMLHFYKQQAYVRIVPPQLANHALVLVQLSGACELLGGLGILMVKARKTAGYGLLALLVAVFPANIYMAVHPQAFKDMAAPAALWLRLPLQFVFMAWVWWCCLA